MIEVEVILRTIASFGVLLIAARFLGKQTISQMTIFDFVAAITLGAITAGMAYNTSLKPHNMLISFVFFVLTIFLISFLSIKNRKLRKFFAGDPTVLIQNGKILESNMRNMRYTLDYLNQQLREKEIFNIEEVLFAILETNGKLTILRKPQFRHITKQDLFIAVHGEHRLPIELIMDGEIIEDNLNQNHLTTSWLLTELKKRDITVEETVYAVLLANGHIYVDKYKDHISVPIDKE
ncbi:DUF421 domain-containing protein [Bacillus atrophaeus]|uniref:DUF421 domain-containing protein n=1 Tax=Bacillus atrophaeus TaxID=1452 RepID=UPI00228281D0|nr:DUF421 domain-containing protein [Bacillus atrophaeus]MCY8839325.1 DUF421 domain-containing protein [Bacillus atrophaeus]MCY8933972.1 DUF421 domain-containing protein [Bacillus atrophaeus]MCY8943285.1 DUF421 domain-containing protein [Bacillus atrophaeus]MCY8946710.1 DUF421 domain-containing protein [Bacillus atrophaeus]MEC5222318.1 DUF421 domain-containing protein [Bacillus atrophaeus]